MCESSSISFDTLGLGLTVVQLLLLLESRVTATYSNVISTEYLQLVTGAIHQVVNTLEKEPLTHDDILTAQRKLMLVKEPLLQLRFDILGVSEDSSKILTVLALHELHNTVAKLLDTLHVLSHVDDQITLTDLDFKNAIMRHLSKIFGDDE